MRVVNGIEREMMQSEWENWLADENGRCEQVRGLVLEDGGGGEGQQQKVLLGGEGQGRKGAEALRTWYNEYCGSCEKDWRVMVGERKSLVMG